MVWDIVCSLYIFVTHALGPNPSHHHPPPLLPLHLRIRGRPWWPVDMCHVSISAGYWDSKQKEIVETTIYLTNWWSNVDLYQGCQISFTYWNPFCSMGGGEFFQSLKQQLAKPSWTLNVFDQHPTSITKQKSKQKVKMVHWYLHPQSLTARPWRMMVWRYAFPFGARLIFRGGLLNFRGVAGWWLIKHFLRNTLRLFWSKHNLNM